MNREYIAYKGQAYEIEWYFNRYGKSNALDYYFSLTAMERIRVLMLFKRMGDIGEIKDTTKFNYEGDKLYAFKPMPDRFLCFFYVGKKIIVTNAFRKKKTKLPMNEKIRGQKYKSDYEIRVEKGEYYDKP